MSRTQSPQPESRREQLPLVQAVPTAPSVAEAFARFASLPHCLLLESASHPISPRGLHLGRYTFLAADPFDWFRAAPGDPSVWAQIARILTRFPSAHNPDLGPFQGGLAGMFSYDLNRTLEKIPAPRHDEFGVPAMALGAYDTVMVWDHQRNDVNIISQGFPETDPDAQLLRARARIAQFEEILDSDPIRWGEPDSPDPQLALAPIHKISGMPHLTSNFSKRQYLAAVEKAVDYIHAGDVFQINLAQRLLCESRCSSVELYMRLRKCNPAPFAGYFDVGDSQIISASPERFVSIQDRQVETRPIKGTRRRTRYPEVDLTVARQLEASEKDRSENTMIVDLMRNDLSRVCQDESIRVGQLCELESYESVLHLVSSVEGHLRDDANLIDLLKAVFPGGSITGAPKVRAMEIISELEPTARGAYCGSLGYLGFDGYSDLNIMIRTITAAKGYWQIPVGGGIVAQSKPQSEYDETWTKAAGMLAALKPDTRN